MIKVTLKNFSEKKKIGVFTTHLTSLGEIPE
jgi:hypothetical protein